MEVFGLLLRAASFMIDEVADHLLHSAPGMMSITEGRKMDETVAGTL
jgi:hypothetical protein